MDKSAYLLDASRTDSAHTLHWLGQTAAADPDLTAREIQEIRDAISKRFGLLNRPATTPKPRW